jgi:N-acetylglutamate synthase-like GNAT family acetyltransferase
VIENYHSITVRKANSTDAPLLCGLIRKSFRDVAVRFKLTQENCPTHPSNCKKDWITTDFAKGTIYYLLERSALPVGCVAIEKATNDLCYLKRLAVLPEERRKGFGNQLVTHVLNTAREWGVKWISIGIIAKQTGLKQWYQKMGFREGETKEFSHLPFSVCFMTYEIKGNIPQ